MGNKWCFSGLGAVFFPWLQSGMKDLAGKTDSEFRALMFGYMGWQKIAVEAEAIFRKTKEIPILMGHSNGVYAILKIAEALNKNGVKCIVVSVDKTLKSCPKADHNVIRIQDHHAKLKYVETVKGYSGVVETYEYPERTHVNVAEYSVMHARVIRLLKEEGRL